MKTIVLWEIDIIWAEALRKALMQRRIVCDEVDSREELEEMARGGFPPVLCIVSEQILADGFSTAGEAVQELQGSTGIPVVMAVEKEDACKELEALKTGAFEVLFKKKDVEIAAERISRLIEIIGWAVRESQGEGKKEFDREFSELSLTKLEMQVLCELYERENQIVSRGELLDKFWKERQNKGNRVVDTVIKQLRKKLENTAYQIQGIYGKGYALKKR